MNIIIKNGAIIVCFALSSICYGQSITYTYDNAGFRISSRPSTTLAKQRDDEMTNINPTSNSIDEHVMVKVENEIIHATLLDANHNNKYKFIISDIKGIRFYNEEVVDHSLSIDIRDFNPGIYILTIYWNNTEQSYKIIKR